MKILTTSDLLKILNLLLETFPKKNTPDPYSFKSELFQIFQEEIIPILSKIIQRVGKKENTSRLFWKTYGNPTLKLHKDIKGTETYRLISCSLTNAALLNPILENQIQWHINRIIYHETRGLFQEYKVGLTFGKMHTYVHQKMCTWIFIAAVFITATWKPPRGLSTVDWINKWRYIHIRQYSPAMRMNWVQPLTNTALREMIQKEKKVPI